MFLLLLNSDIRQNMNNNVRVRRMESLGLEVAKQKVVRRTMKITTKRWGCYPTKLNIHGFHWYIYVCRWYVRLCVLLHTIVTSTFYVSCLTIYVSPFSRVQKMIHRRVLKAMLLLMVLREWLPITTKKATKRWVAIQKYPIFMLSVDWYMYLCDRVWFFLHVIAASKFSLTYIYLLCRTGEMWNWCLEHAVHLQYAFTLMIPMRTVHLYPLALVNIFLI